MLFIDLQSLTTKFYTSVGYLLKGVIWIVASRLEPFSKIRYAPMGSSVENLDSKKPPPRLVLSKYVLSDFVTYPYQPYQADF